MNSSASCCRKPENLLCFIASSVYNHNRLGFTTFDSFSNGRVFLIAPAYVWSPKSKPFRNSTSKNYLQARSPCCPKPYTNPYTNRFNGRFPDKHRLPGWPFKSQSLVTLIWCILTGQPNSLYLQSISGPRGFWSSISYRSDALRAGNWKNTRNM